jgi:hypothetical protein
VVGTANKKSRSDPLYHLSHGQRGSDGSLSEPVIWLARPPKRKSQANAFFRRTLAATLL